jgi:hypothetical protein
MVADYNKWKITATKKNKRKIKPQHVFPIFL